MVRSNSYPTAAISPTSSSLRDSRRSWAISSANEGLTRPRRGRERHGKERAVKLKPIEEQVVVVMGASSGIGREAALRFAKRGAKVVVAARSEAGLRSLEGEIREDRKSTRLNSSHANISYAVFCLKKK